MGLIKKIETFLIIVFGFLIRLFFRNTSTNGTVIIGSSSGQGFSDNGKHLFIWAYQRDKKVYFVTKSKKLYKELTSVYGNKILYNYSFSGIRKILMANYYFFTHNRGDIVFVHNNKTKKVCLFHGMPIKCIGRDYKGNALGKNRIISELYNKWGVGFSFTDYNHIVSLSPFFNKFFLSAWGNPNITLLSYPRINYLIDKIKEDKKPEVKTILYMPTHRAFGKGKLNPFIFFEDPSFRNFLLEQGYILKYRFHPNMRTQLKGQYIDDELFDSFEDSQDSLANADILISDYSSCIFDYLICERPIIFFLYDNYEQADNPLYYPVKSLNLGPVVQNEAELKNIITKIIINGEFKDSLIENIKGRKNKFISEGQGWNDYELFFN